MNEINVGKELKCNIIDNRYLGKKQLIRITYIRVTNYSNIDKIYLKVSQ